ncbi:GreA/GreB family elongation factor [Pedosphaera parvula]|uniref:GreA/GreB family elongation factor n=1 Tax=Pedosphaera parvula (strain Ellin514) TaxID=320771 RepID=B9XEY1_PEDPL|nr:GreA/GreB family elongation factor [Pedosphaera parvula]EEF61479.1 GreA/GreB family elongation factor [Pedosphaera parvula Ellin514]
MSKAFTKEADDNPEAPTLPRPVSVLPPGAKNYLTPDGAQRLRAELNRLQAEKRSQTATGEFSGNAQTEMQLVGQHILQLEQSLATAEIVPPPPQPWEQVRFGATVTVRDESGNETRYRIVGVDETDIDRDWVSWLSPIARALINARIGERVHFRFPAGEKQLEIVSITYE